MIEVLDRVIKMPPVLQMRPYQQRWIDDNSRFKCAVKAARIGYSFATGYRRVEMSMRVPGRTTTVLSASKAQSIEFVETCAKLCQLMGGTAQMIANEDFVEMCIRDRIDVREHFRFLLRLRAKQQIALAA